MGRLNIDRYPDKALRTRMATYLRTAALAWIPEWQDSDDEEERAAPKFHQLANLAETYLQEMGE